MSSNTTVVAGPGFASILFFIFLILKLCSVITWSWWWVTAPLWIPFALAAGIIVVSLLAALLIVVVTFVLDRIL